MPNPEINTVIGNIIGPNYEQVAVRARDNQGGVVASVYNRSAEETRVIEGILPLELIEPFMEEEVDLPDPPNLDEPAVKSVEPITIRKLERTADVLDIAEAHPQVALLHKDAIGNPYFPHIEREAVLDDKRSVGRLIDQDPDLTVALYGLSVLSVVQYLHEQGIIIEGIEPSTLYEQERAGRPLIRFADFRTAISVGGPASGLGLAGKDLAYLPPEQVLGEPALPQNDIFSVGAVLHRARFGQAPYEEGSDEAQRRQDRIKNPSTFYDAQGRPVHPKLAAIIRRAIAKNPAERPAEARAMAEELHAFVLGVTTA